MIEDKRGQGSPDVLRPPCPVITQMAPEADGPSQHPLHAERNTHKALHAIACVTKSDCHGNVRGRPLH